MAQTVKFLATIRDFYVWGEDDENAEIEFADISKSDAHLLLSDPGKFLFELDSHVEVTITVVEQLK